jgi:hypothetical protein
LPRRWQPTRRPRISKAAQVSKAASQASFFCYAWQCSSRSRVGAAYSGGTLKTLWRLNNPKNIIGHAKCRTWVLMSIDVTSSGGVRSRLVKCA